MTRAGSGWQKARKKYRHWLRRLRKGDRVLCLYDGKRGRAVEGEVVRSKSARKGRVTVRFSRWVGDGVVEAVFTNGEGCDRGSDMMRNLIGERGDYYNLCPLPSDKKE